MRLANENKWSAKVTHVKADALYKGVALATGTVTDLEIPSEGFLLAAHLTSLALAPGHN